MDEDLERLSRDELLAEVKKLRAGVRTHRNSGSLDEQLPDAPRTQEPPPRRVNR